MKIAVYILAMCVCGVASAQIQPSVDSTVQTFINKTISNNVIYADDVKPSNSGATNDANMAAHISVCNLTIGGCTIQLGSYTTPIPMANSSGPAILLGTSVATGTATADTPYNNIAIVGQGWTVSQSTQRAVSGTVLQGTSTSFPIIAYNYVNNTVDYSSLNNLTASYVNGVNLENFAVDNCSTCIEFGALSKSGLYFSRMKHLYASNFARWGYWFENYQLTDFDDLTAAAPTSASNGGGPISQTGNGGMMAFVASFGSLIQPGNANYRKIFTQSLATSTPRGIVFMQRTSAAGNAGQFNDNNIYGIQSNLGGTNQSTPWSATATVQGGGTTLQLSSYGTGASSASFPVDMPVFVANDNYNFNQYEYTLLFVKTNNGTGLISLSTTQGGAAVSLTPANADTLYTWGWPAIEVVGYGASNVIQPIDLHGVDTEATASTFFYVQNANIQLDWDTFGDGQGVTAGANSASSLAARNSGVVVRAASPMILDLDPTSANQSSLYGSLANDTALFSSLTQINGFAAGIFQDRGGGTFGLSLGGQTVRAQISQLISANSLNGGESWLMPLVGLGQRAVYDTSGTAALSGRDAGAEVWKGSSPATKTLPVVTTTAYIPNSGVTAELGAYGLFTNGASYSIFNQGTANYTLQPNTGQFFNANSAMTAMVIPPGAFAQVRAQTDGSTGYWVVETMIGAYFSTFAAPVVTACGTSPSIDSKATNSSGTVTVGTVAAASCTVTFANSGFTTWNHCNVTSQTTLAAFGYSYTKTVLTVTGTSLVGDLFDYRCDGS